MTTVAPFIFHQGSEPLFITMPHTGVWLPDEIAGALTPEARSVPDTDWHIEQLYAFARQMGASWLQATCSRYVVDLNRPPDGASLYPGQATTGLCPETRFDGGPVYPPGAAPSSDEVQARRRRYWQPWHDKLAEELLRLKARFPRVVLWDAHSIRSVLPQFFDGRLPDFNIGTHKGASCAPALQQRIAAIARAASPFTQVENGRYTGGYITRHYGQPSQGVHAVQMELAQCSYMDETPPWRWQPQKARLLQPHLQAMLQSALEFAHEGR
ncbi:N-formylglutamate deformylase [Brenneria goodwinii]|uniref:N-formylglutamate deformylase n=1 Tax=Brenneria goodwinii TaxID=1109412 RepID=A0A0G4K2G4_9GAMM|nr:N-formylglutamate deformylase [Brenneria goodwinii]ATA26964.1 N-formylglutamate deformylase [Brenneria goodwinii]RLM23978.1 N-formylglutamate deformylase [Brenneria goodwinii]CPR21277.1 N-formylglutamate deformylase [Brenneria goodwinii]